MARRRHSIVDTAQVPGEFEIDTPMGPKTVQYGMALYGSGFRLTYRSQDLQDSTMDGLRKQIEKAEVEFQAKKARDAKRKEMAKNPEEAVIFTPPGTRKREVRDPNAFRGWKTIHERHGAEFEEIKVRGVDQRSGEALVTHADGSNSPHTWGQGGRWAKRRGYNSGPVILRPLEPEERADILAASRAHERAVQARDEVKFPSVNDVLKASLGEDAEVTVGVAYDLESNRFYAEFEGVTYWGEKDREVLSQVLVALMAKEGYYFKVHSTSSLIPLTQETKDLWTSDSVCRTEEEFAHYVRLNEASVETYQALVETINQYLFDRSLVVIPEDEPEEPQDDEERVTVPDVHAPEVEPEWSDD